MPAHSRSRNGVAELAYVAGLPLRRTLLCVVIGMAETSLAMTTEVLLPSP